MAAVCGTYAGYKRHSRAKETPCDPCRQAKRDYVRDQRDRSRREAVSTGIPPAPAEEVEPTDDQPGVLRDNLRRIEAVIQRVQEHDPTRLVPLLKERRDTVALLVTLNEAQGEDEDEFSRARRARAAGAAGA